MNEVGSISLSRQHSKNVSETSKSEKLLGEKKTLKTDPERHQLVNFLRHDPVIIDHSDERRHKREKKHASSLAACVFFICS